jgi:hypothetical protein
MEYVGLLRFRPQVSAEERDRALMRRAAWTYPEGIRPIAEYWPSSDQVQVVSVFAADSFAPVMELQYEWSDVFDISISPAVSAEEGLRIGPEVFGRLSRLQNPPQIPEPSRAAPAESSPPVNA